MIQVLGLLSYRDKGITTSGCKNNNEHENAMYTFFPSQ